MTLDTTIMALGAFVALLPFLQLPQDWTAFFTSIAGVVVIGLGIVVRRRFTHTHTVPPAPSYSEMKDVDQSDPSDAQY